MGARSDISRLENLDQLSNDGISCFCGACAAAHVLGSQPRVNGGADRVLDDFSLVGEIQRIPEHHGYGKDGANGILKMMSALYSQRIDRNRPKRGLNARQSLFLICPARYLSSTLVTDVYIRARVEDRGLTMNRFADGRHCRACRARNPAETRAREEPYASSYGARLVAENIP